MKKLLLTLTTVTALLFSTESNARDITWQQTHKTEAQASSINHINSTAFVYILNNSSNDYAVNMGMVVTNPMPDFSCEDKTITEAPVNGRYVNFIRSNNGTNSNGEGVCVYFPYTKAGMDYVVNEFKKKNIVTINGSKFTAKGYNKIVKQILKTTKQKSL